MSPSIYFGILILGCIVGFFALHHGEKAAWSRRVARLEDCDPTPIDEWLEAISDVPPETVEHCTRLIADTINVDPRSLRPNDAFRDQLSIIDGFFCIIEDDDTDECIRDQIEETTGVRPDGTWHILRDVVNDFARIQNRPEARGTRRYTRAAKSAEFAVENFLSPPRDQ